MQSIISCHFDTIYQDPFAKVRDGFITGACDNIASLLVCAQLIEIPDIHIEFTEEEERHMDGARYVARKHSQEDTFIIVLDLDNYVKGSKIKFFVENYSGIQTKHIRKALKEFNGSYRLKENGAESEAWLYKELGFACLEIDIPVIGGIHNLEGRCKIEDILCASRAVLTIHNYVKDKTRSQISDIYKVGGIE